MTEPTTARLDDQISWYDVKSNSSQRRFKLLKSLQLAAAAAMPVLAPFGVHAAVPAALGAVIMILEGFLQLNQY